MRNTIKTLVLAGVMAATISLSLPDEAHARYYGHGFGHGFRHSFGRGFGPYDFRFSNSGDVRIEVDPKGSREDIQVYVDEGHAGVVDDFDGFFQRLSLPLGKHEIEIRLDGYKTIRQSIFVSPGRTIHIRERMEPLA